MRLFLPLVAAMLVLAGCSGDSSPPLALSPLRPVSLEVDRGVLLDYATEAAASDFGSTHDYAISELSTRVPLTLTVRSATRGAVKINGELVPTNTPRPVALSRIGSDDKISVEYLDAQAADVVLTIHAVPASMPTYG